MKSIMLAGVLCGLLGSAAVGQSVLTLDSFDLDDPADPAPSARPDPMADCIATNTCKGDGFSSGVDISLDYVFNLGVVDRDEVDEAAVKSTSDPLPTVDLEIRFAYDSDDLSYEAMQTLAGLTSALQDPRLASAKLIFIGHTDAAGGESYNMDLSRRRAEAVATHVMATMRIPASRVDAVGVGYSRLKNTADPNAAENRRVQLVLVPGA